MDCGRGWLVVNLCTPVGAGGTAITGVGGDARGDGAGARTAILFFGGGFVGTVGPPQQAMLVLRY